MRYQYSSVSSCLSLTGRFVSLNMCVFKQSSNFVGIFSWRTHARYIHACCNVEILLRVSNGSFSCPAFSITSLICISVEILLVHRMRFKGKFAIHLFMHVRGLVISFSSLGCSHRLWPGTYKPERDGSSILRGIGVFLVFSITVYALENYYQVQSNGTLPYTTER